MATVALESCIISKANQLALDEAQKVTGNARTDKLVSVLIRIARADKNAKKLARKLEEEEPDELGGDDNEGEGEDPEPVSSDSEHGGGHSRKGKGKPGRADRRGRGGGRRSPTPSLPPDLSLPPSPTRSPNKPTAEDICCLKEQVRVLRAELEIQRQKNLEAEARRQGTADGAGMAGGHTDVGAALVEVGELAEQVRLLTAAAAANKPKDDKDKRGRGGGGGHCGGGERRGQDPGGDFSSSSPSPSPAPRRRDKEGKHGRVPRPPAPQPRQSPSPSPHARRPRRPRSPSSELGDRMRYQDYVEAKRGMERSEERRKRERQATVDRFDAAREYNEYRKRHRHHY